MVNTAAPGYAYPVSKLIQHRLILRVRCHTRKTLHHYRPEDLIQIFGDADVNSLHRRRKCEQCRRNSALSVDFFQPVGSDAIGLKIRRLVAIKLLRVPVWREE